MPKPNDLNLLARLYQSAVTDEQKKKVNSLLGLLEVGGNFASGSLAQLGGGLSYLPAAAMGGNDAGQAVMRSVQDAYTYQPRSDAGQRYLGALGNLVGPIAKSGSVGAQTFADNVYNATGSPVLGAAARTAPAAIQAIADRARLSKSMEMAPMQKATSIEKIQENMSNAGIDAHISESKILPNVITVHKIVVPKQVRGAGIGSAAMREIISHADANGKTIALSPSTDFGATSVNRLKEFYKRLGFVENKGRNKDFTISETMYRMPAK